ncbi:hypothetical protein EJ06DRAFT_606 [Trichodelitschia bisporula]|uniref:Acyltransferase MbtK/IucB-like conserved domain-containing protein n=1 Tax=Trichodelitschia bisporula TaxID=703511 RepID=A0A6G1I9G7_9PEZI|nr:hypothetical protein EJ06DRAFT_606 [Trichodelitschia bisporula]
MATTTTTSTDPLKPIALTKLRLPHPHLTTYYVVPTQAPNTTGLQVLRSSDPSSSALEPPSPLHNTTLTFTAPQTPSDASVPPTSDNTPWARALRAPSTTLTWSGAAPSLGQIWLIVHALLQLHPDLEIIRATLTGTDSEALKRSLIVSTLATPHPTPIDTPQPTTPTAELILHRAAFWQGAASPFGTHPAWTPSTRPSLPIEVPSQVLTTGFPGSRVHMLHPSRPAKPTPGSIVYSRYIPSLDAHFSLQALDVNDEAHVALFHKWQNDPRVARGWNEAGSLGAHRAYLQKQHDDPHSLPVLGRFDDVAFSYFEIYWTKEDHVGAHYAAGDWDRGRHSLVGDARYRGRHRVLGWWSCIIHFCFLDDARTGAVVGEPAAHNAGVLVYDYTHGLNVEKFVDFPHKRAVLVRVTRERFFQLCPLNQQGGFIAGTGVPLPAKL